MARVGAIIISLRALTAMPCAVENGGNGYRAYGATVHPGNPRMGRMPNVILPALSITPASLCLLPYVNHWGMQDEIAHAPGNGHHLLRQTVIFRPFHRDFLKSRVYS